MPKAMNEEQDAQNLAYHRNILQSKNATDAVMASVEEEMKAEGLSHEVDSALVNCEEIAEPVLEKWEVAEVGLVE